VKVLALYDIHGNVDALEAVLSDPRAADPDAVVVGGDAVPGPFAAAALDRLESLSAPVHWVRGNGEREVAAAVGAPAGARLLEAGWPDERSIRASLIEPVEPIVVTRIFEGMT
jgi:predicted phosphodiesterase